MNSSCEVSPSTTADESGRVSDAGSRIHRLMGAWTGVAAEEYKPAADHHCGVSRTVLVGAAGEKTSFEVRYFEIAPGGRSTLERHEHEHVVVVLRGAGQVRLGETWHDVAGNDTVYVAPDEVHQLRNVGGEAFGFLCIVDARRDRPRPVA